MHYYNIVWMMMHYAHYDCLVVGRVTVLILLYYIYMYVRICGFNIPEYKLLKWIYNVYNMHTIYNIYNLCNIYTLICIVYILYISNTTALKPLLLQWLRNDDMQNISSLILHCNNAFLNLAMDIIKTCFPDLNLTWWIIPSGKHSTNSTIIWFSAQYSDYDIHHYFKGPDYKYIMTIMMKCEHNSTFNRSSTQTNYLHASLANVTPILPPCLFCSLISHSLSTHSCPYLLCNYLVTIYLVITFINEQWQLSSGVEGQKLGTESI